MARTYGKSPNQKTGGIPASKTNVKVSRFPLGQFLKTVYGVDYMVSMFVFIDEHGNAVKYEDHYSVAAL